MAAKLDYATEESGAGAQSGKSVKAMEWNDRGFKISICVGVIQNINDEKESHKDNQKEERKVWIKREHAKTQK